MDHPNNYHSKQPLPAGKRPEVKSSRNSPALSSSKPKCKFPLPPKPAHLPPESAVISNFPTSRSSSFPPPPMPFMPMPPFIPTPPPQLAGTPPFQTTSLPGVLTTPSAANVTPKTSPLNNRFNGDRLPSYRGQSTTEEEVEARQKYHETRNAWASKGLQPSALTPPHLESERQDRSKATGSLEEDIRPATPSKSRTADDASSSHDKVTPAGRDPSSKSSSKESIPPKNFALFAQLTAKNKSTINAEPSSTESVANGQFKIKAVSLPAAEPVEKALSGPSSTKRSSGQLVKDQTINAKEFLGPIKKNDKGNSSSSSITNENDSLGQANKHKSLISTEKDKVSSTEERSTVLAKMKIPKLRPTTDPTSASSSKSAPAIASPVAPASVSAKSKLSIPKQAVPAAVKPRPVLPTSSYMPFEDVVALMIRNSAANGGQIVRESKPASGRASSSTAAPASLSKAATLPIAAPRVSRKDSSSASTGTTSPLVNRKDSKDSTSVSTSNISSRANRKDSSSASTGTTSPPVNRKDSKDSTSASTSNISSRVNRKDSTSASTSNATPRVSRQDSTTSAPTSTTSQSSHPKQFIPDFMKKTADRRPKAGVTTSKSIKYLGRPRLENKAELEILEKEKVARALARTAGERASSIHPDSSSSSSLVAKKETTAVGRATSSKAWLPAGKASSSTTSRSAANASVDVVKKDTNKRNSLSALKASKESRDTKTRASTAGLISDSKKETSYKLKASEESFRKKESSNISTTPKESQSLYKRKSSTDSLDTNTKEGSSYKPKESEDSLHTSTKKESSTYRKASTDSLSTHSKEGSSYKRNASKDSLDIDTRKESSAHRKAVTHSRNTDSTKDSSYTSKAPDSLHTNTREGASHKSKLSKDTIGTETTKESSSDRKATKQTLTTFNKKPSTESINKPGKKSDNGRDKIGSSSTSRTSIQSLIDPTATVASLIASRTPTSTKRSRIIDDGSDSEPVSPSRISELRRRSRIIDDDESDNEPVSPKKPQTTQKDIVPSSSPQAKEPIVPAKSAGKVTSKNHTARRDSGASVSSTEPDFEVSTRRIEATSSGSKSARSKETSQTKPSPGNDTALKLETPRRAAASLSVDSKGKNPFSKTSSTSGEAAIASKMETTPKRTAASVPIPVDSKSKKPIITTSMTPPARTRHAQVSTSPVNDEIRSAASDLFTDIPKELLSPIKEGVVITTPPNRPSRGKKAKTEQRNDRDSASSSMSPVKEKASITPKRKRRESSPSPTPKKRRMRGGDISSSDSDIWSDDDTPPKAPNPRKRKASSSPEPDAPSSQTSEPFTGTLKDLLRQKELELTRKAAAESPTKKAKYSDASASIMRSPSKPTETPSSPQYITSLPPLPRFMSRILSSSQASSAPAAEIIAVYKSQRPRQASAPPSFPADIPRLFKNIT